MKDIHSDLTRVVAIGAAALDATNTPPAVDLHGYHAAEILLDVGVGGITFDGTNKIEFKLTHSDDNVSYSAVSTADMLGVTVGAGGIIKVLASAHAAAGVYRYGYKGARRYLKLQAEFFGTHGSPTPIAASVLKGYGHDNPQANQA